LGFAVKTKATGDRVTFWSYFQNVGAHTAALRQRNQESIVNYPGLPLQNARIHRRGKSIKPTASFDTAAAGEDDS
jgi:hypothetical protein